MRSRLKSRLKAGRSRGSLWSRAFDLFRLLFSEGGGSRLWTQVVHRTEVHQTSPYTEEERYPELFDRAASLCPNAKRILSFGCSTGAELAAIRRRFPDASIVGVEINPRSRRLAARRAAKDSRTVVVPPHSIDGTFDIIFALAVLQRLPCQVEEARLEDISKLYPFQKFDAAVCSLVGRIEPGGLFCIFHAHFPVELSSVSSCLEAVAASPLLEPLLFGPDGKRLHEGNFRSIFRKL